MYLISYSSWKDGFDYHSSWFSTNYPKSQTWSIIHQLNGLNMLPMNLQRQKLKLSSWNAKYNIKVTPLKSITMGTQACLHKPYTKQLSAVPCI